MRHWRKNMKIRKKESIYEISTTYFSETYQNFDDDGETTINYFRGASSSFKLVAWVMQFSSLRGSDKLVAATIASYYGYKRKYCFPTYQQIADDTGFSYGTISKGIKNMKLSGEWVVKRRGLSIVRRSNNCYAPLAPLKDDLRDKDNMNWIPSKMSPNGDWLQNTGGPAYASVTDYNNNFIKNINTKWMNG